MTDADTRGPATHDDGGPTIEDSELLRRYALEGSEAAFAELVRRRIGLVYSVALRQTRGDRHRAEDATQAVFTDLARKATALAQRPVLAGWLYRSAQFAAAGLVRAEHRRHTREQDAHTMETILAPEQPEPDWDKLGPVLDQALNDVDERDRDAIVLRFFDGRPFAEIGARLRLTESAARMRVERALDKLHAALGRRGITSTTAALSAALANQIGAAMPAGLATTVTGAALAQTAAVAGGWAGSFMSISILQVGIAGAVAVAGATGYVLQEKTNATLRQEIAALQGQPQIIAAQRAENQRLASAAAEAEMLRLDDIELKELAQRVADAQKINAEATRLARRQENDLNRQKNIQDEIERMNREGNALVEEYRALVTASKAAGLTPEDRATADAAVKLKLAAIQAKQREIKAYIESTGGTAPGQLQMRTAETQRARGISGTTWEASLTGSAPTPERTGGESVSLRLPQADYATALSVLETMSGVKVARDPSLVGIRGTLDLKTERITKEEAMHSLEAALRNQLNIIVETVDGKIVAKRGPAR